MEPSIEQVFAARDRFRRKMEAVIPMEQRVRDLFEQMARKVPGTGMTPEGYLHFLRRNFRTRAIDPNEAQ